MGRSLEERIAYLAGQSQPLAPEDPMAEAGRKVLLAEFVKMLQHQEGSRSGADIEDVHDMRVAIRRIRSAFRLLKPYFKAKTARPYRRALRRAAWTLGEIRDLDVLIDDLRAFQVTLDPEAQAGLQQAIDALDQQRQAGREHLNAVFDSKDYRRFVKGFSNFTTTAIAAPKAAEGMVVPSQARHLLPGLIYDHLGSVLAYEEALNQADAVMLHSLRIEIKRLRYAVSLFESLLGAQISDFIASLKAMQECLGQLNDIASARLRLEETEAPSDALSAYLAQLDTREAGLRSTFGDVWARFTSRKAQQKLSNAVLALH